MDLDEDELIATRDGGRCEFCNLKGPFYNSKAKIYELNGKFRITTDEVDTEIKYCPICSRKLK